MAKEHRLPPLSFDSSSSAQARFFGTPFQVGFHYVDNSGLGMLKMVCINDLGYEGGEKCQVCAKSPPATRMIAIAWDVRASRWSLYMAPTGTFKEIFEKCKAEGVNPAMLDEGKGPDVLLTKVGKTTEIFVMPETIGQPRGDKVVYRGEGDWAVNDKKRDYPYPPIDRIVKALYNNSVWRFCASVEQARRENPRERVDILGARPPDMNPPEPRFNFNFRLLRDTLRPPLEPLPPAQQGPIKAKPKGVPKQPPKLPDIAEDRFDIV